MNEDRRPFVSIERRIMTKGKKIHRKRRYKLKPRFFVIITVLLAVVLLLAFRIMAMVLPNFFDAGKRDEVAAVHGCTYEQGIRIMVAAKGYINSGLKYDDQYYAGGYPPEKIGVCTDVVWKGLKGLDVTLKDLVDQDIADSLTAYSGVISSADSNIDFRLVPVLRQYFDRHCVKLSNDPSNLLDWQPGDFVVFEDKHVAVVSSLHNGLGYSYVIQHGKDPAGDEDRLLTDDLTITGHYRWGQTITIGSRN